MGNASSAPSELQPEAAVAQVASEPGRLAAVQDISESTSAMDASGDVLRAQQLCVELAQIGYLMQPHVTQQRILAVLHAELHEDIAHSLLGGGCHDAEGNQFAKAMASLNHLSRNALPSALPSAQSCNNNVTSIPLSQESKIEKAGILPGRTLSSKEVARFLRKEDSRKRRQLARRRRMAAKRAEIAK